jgi:amino acid permease
MTAPPEPEAAGGAASISSCVYNLTNTIIGSGVLALPAAFAMCGSALGSGLLLLFALFSAHGLHLLSLSAQIIEERRSSAGDPPTPASFRQVASAAAPRFASCVDLAVMIKCFGVACSYLIVVGDSLPIVAQRALPDVPWAGRREPWILFAAFVVTPLALKKKLDNLRLVSAASLLCCGGIALLVVTEMFSSDRAVDTNYVVFDGATLKNLPIFVFGFTCHQNIFAVNNELKNPTRRRLDVVVVCAIGLALVFYLVIANAGYATFGSKIKPDLLKSYAATSAVALARIAVAIEVTSAIPLQLHPSRMCVRSLLEQLRPAPSTDYALIDGEAPPRRRSSSQGDDDRPAARDIEHILITMSFLAGALAVALSVRSLGKVLALVGATGSTTISYILPGGIYWRVGPPGHKRCMAAGQFLLGCVIMPAALTFVFLK